MVYTANDFSYCVLEKLIKLTTYFWKVLWLRNSFPVGWMDGLAAQSVGKDLFKSLMQKGTLQPSIVVLSNKQSVNSVEKLSKTSNLWAAMQELLIMYIKPHSKRHACRLQSESYHSVIGDCEAKRCLAGTDVSSYIASDGTNWHCNACGKGFTESKNCRRHVREKHFGLDRDTCPHCNKEVSRRYIKDHIVTCKQARHY